MDVGLKDFVRTWAVFSIELLGDKRETRMKLLMLDNAGYQGLRVEDTTDAGHISSYFLRINNYGSPCNLSQISFDDSNVLTVVAKPTVARLVVSQPVTCPGMKRSNTSTTSLLLSLCLFSAVATRSFSSSLALSAFDLEVVTRGLSPLPFVAVSSFPDGKRQICTQPQIIENPSE